MSKIRIENTCNGCGCCFILNKYIREDENGLAKQIVGLLIDPNDETKVQEICELCPCNAIVFEKQEQNQKEYIRNLVKELKNELSSFSVPRLDHNNAPFVVSKYSFDFPSSQKEITTDFKTKSSARAAAKNEFDNLVYGASARNAQITRIIMDYKAKYANLYCHLENDDRSFYYQTNKEIEQKLESFAKIYESATGTKLPSGWTKISVFPDKNSIMFIGLQDYPKYDSVNDQIWNYIRDLGPTSLDDYVDYMTFDCFDWGDGGFFDSLFAAKDWTFSGFDNATDEFIKDMMRAFNYYKSNIENSFHFYVNCVLEEYETQMREVLLSKVSLLKVS